MVNIKNLVGELPGSCEFVHLGYIVDDREKYLPFFKDMFGIEEFDCYDYYTELTRNQRFFRRTDPTQNRMLLS